MFIPAIADSVEPENIGTAAAEAFRDSSQIAVVETLKEEMTLNDYFAQSDTTDAKPNFKIKYPDSIWVVIAKIDSLKSEIQHRAEVSAFAAREDSLRSELESKIVGHTLIHELNSQRQEDVIIIKNGTWKRIRVFTKERIVEGYPEQIMWGLDGRYEKTTNDIYISFEEYSLSPLINTYASKPLVNTDFNETQPRLSPNGERIAYVVNYGLAVIDANRDNNLRLTISLGENYGSVKSYAWSPDSRKIAVYMTSFNTGIVQENDTSYAKQPSSCRFTMWVISLEPGLEPKLVAHSLNDFITDYGKFLPDEQEEPVWVDNNTLIYIDWKLVPNTEENNIVSTAGWIMQPEKWLSPVVKKMYVP